MLGFDSTFVLNTRCEYVNIEELLLFSFSSLCAVQYNLSDVIEIFIATNSPSYFQCIT